jgi:hypothetical protein
VLRSESRSDSGYYELSHDTLVEPVLATRRKRALLLGWLGLLAGVFVSVVMSFIGLFLLYFFAFEFDYAEANAERFGQIFEAAVSVLAMFGVAVFSFGLARGGLRKLSRYRRRAPEGADTEHGGNTVSIVGIILGAIALLFFPIIFGPAGIICAAVGRSKKQWLANAALAVSIGGTILGAIFGMLWHVYSY